jgi:protocatechuate 3,4-dioxygenase beta subunit
MTQRISRRRALGALGTVSLGALLGACGSDEPKVATTEGGTATVEPKSAPASSLVDKLDAAGSCAQTAEQTEGPYYFDADAIRSDIREGSKGTRLALALRVREADGCTPIENAVVDLWHCDATGVYSGFESGEGERFLRGAQATNEDGIARFTTIYPGAYQGRTVHIHAKVHIDNSTVLTTQLYFEDETSDRVYAEGDYPGHGDGRQRNDADGIFDPSLVLTLERRQDGYLGLMNFDVART